MQKHSLCGKIFTVALATATAVCAVEWFTERTARNFVKYCSAYRHVPARHTAPCGDELEEHAACDDLPSNA